MTEQQRLFLVQARSDFAVFAHLRVEGRFPPCHVLHFLQMATEKLGKVYAWRAGPPPKLTHKTLTPYVRSLLTDKSTQTVLGFGGQTERWRSKIREAWKWAGAIEALAPQLAGEGPNLEYPWPAAWPRFAPAEQPWPLWTAISRTAEGGRFVRLIEQLLARAEELF